MTKFSILVFFNSLLHLSLDWSPSSLSFPFLSFHLFIIHCQEALSLSLAIRGPSVSIPCVQVTHPVPLCLVMSYQLSHWSLMSTPMPKSGKRFQWPLQYICPSKSPMAIFFVDKKDGKLRPVQDYQALNDITIKNAAPLPLIPELINKLQGAWYFTKLDIQWGYNNIHVKEGDEHNTAFKTPLGLFEPTVMTFGLCNAPATFRTFMNNIFADMICWHGPVIWDFACHVMIEPSLSCFGICTY